MLKHVSGRQVMLLEYPPRRALPTFSFRFQQRYFEDMTVSSINTGSPIMSASAMQKMNQVSDVSTEASGPAAGSITSGSLKTGLQIPVQSEGKAGLESSAAPISRLQSSQVQSTAQAASEAYTTKPGAVARMNAAENAGRSQNINLTA
jgi:hypothetical protein